MIEYLLAKFGKWIAAAGAIAMALLYAFTRGRSEGKAVGQTQVTNQINQQAAKVEKKLEQVDRAPIDFDTAVSNLRKRGKGGAKK